MNKRNHKTLYSLVPVGLFVLLIQVYAVNRSGEERTAAEHGDFVIAGAVKIDTVYGARRVYTDTEYNYRVRVKNGSTWPIFYEWTIDKRIHTLGNNIVHQFSRPGWFTVDVEVSNEYGSDSQRIWVYAVDRTIVRPPVAGVEPAAGIGGSISDDGAVTVRALPSDVRQEGTYYSWAVETHLSRSSAERALATYAKLGLPHVRVYEDQSGAGTPAFRVLVGQFETQRRALTGKRQIEGTVNRKISLITIRG